MTLKNKGNMYTVKEAMAILHIEKPNTIYGLINSGRLTAVRVTPRKTIITEADLIAFMAQNTIHGNDFYEHQKTAQ